MQIGVLLINLGTPNQPTAKHVRAYLKEFLSDPRVVDLSYIVRWMLVNLFILPTRVAKSTKAYQEIWTKQGSPLLIHSKQLRDQVAKHLGDGYCVELGMRYGNPSIADAVQKLQDYVVDKIIVLPLFPQYASASTGSAIQETLRVLSTYTTLPNIEVRSDFFADTKFIRALAEVTKKHLAGVPFDYLLMSHHGLPERQVISSEKGVYCNNRDICPPVVKTNRFCYRAQCYQTSSLLAQELSLSANQWGVGFQSRLGRTPWIQPYTDEVMPNLIQRGIKNLAICCPSFVADCLETLEEIGIRGKKQWQELGGDTFSLAPCLNAHPAWVEAVGAILTKTYSSPGLPVELTC